MSLLLKGKLMSNENINLPEAISVLIEAAISMHEMFISLTTAGFTESQALYIVSQVLRPQA